MVLSFFANGEVLYEKNNFVSIVALLCCFVVLRREACEQALLRKNPYGAVHLWRYFSAWVWN